MADSKSEKNIQTAWLLQGLHISSEVASYQLSVLWEEWLGTPDIDRLDFGVLFSEYGKVLHLVEVLERRALSSEQDRESLAGLVRLAMDCKATHEALYEDAPLLKDKMAGYLREAISAHLDYFGDLEAVIGTSLNVPGDSDGIEDHPLDDLLGRRDQLGWIVIGLRLVQPRDQYLTIDVDRVDTLMRRFDLVLRKKVMECVTYHYKSYRDWHPYNPPDFWWRSIPGHEYRPPA